MDGSLKLVVNWLMYILKFILGQQQNKESWIQLRNKDLFLCCMYIKGSLNQKGGKLTLVLAAVFACFDCMSMHLALLTILIRVVQNKAKLIFFNYHPDKVGKHKCLMWKKLGDWWYRRGVLVKTQVSAIFATIAQLF